MPLFDSIERLGRAIFESPFDAAHSLPELTEINLAVIDAVKAQSHRTGSVRVFSDNLIRVQLRGVPEAQASAFESGLLADHLAANLRKSLSRSGVRFPENLRVEVRTVPDLPRPGDGWVAVETEKDVEKIERTAPARLTARSARLVVTVGTANKVELYLNKPRTNIGRTIDVFHAAGPARRNDLAFAEESEVNRSVSREHAHIIVDKESGEYRIYNDRWYKGGDCGLWILRDGLSQPVHRGHRGVALLAGDEIHIGRAVIKFVQSSAASSEK
jgi:hypothetical protein